MTRSLHDVVVVGAGPAGSATAAFLARRGIDVVLLERATFPRPKPCAEYLSPEASRVLDRLGVLRILDREHPARLSGMRIVSPNGTIFTGRFLGAHPFRGYSDHGLALPREVLDARLAEAAVAHGARLVEGATVEGFADGPSGARSLVVRTAGQRTVVSGRVVVGADGLNSRIARLLGVSRRGRLRRLALVTHAVQVAGMEDVGEMHVGRGGYVGLAPVGGGVTNVAVVTAPADTRPLARWFHSLLAGYPSVRDRLSQAEFVSRVRAVGPFAHRAQPATADRLILVGDAADFYDPFTGEGIYAALHGAELAATHAARGLEHDRLGAGDLAAYDAARHRAFAGKWAVERVVGWALERPRLFDHVARRLASRPPLADLLVGVTGDFVPPSRVLRPSFAWQLVY